MWVGGKYFLAKKLIALFPLHTTYVEPFGGAAHVILRKRPSACEIYNDIDGRLVNFFRVVANPEKCGELMNRLSATLYSREVWNEAKMSVENGSDIDKAYHFAILNKQSFGGKMGTWGVDIARDTQTGAFANMPNVIAQAHQRMRRVQIEHKDYAYILSRYDRPETLFYLDPPYPFTGQRGKDKLYAHEMTDADHRQMVELLLKIKGKAILSGYDTPLYEPLETAGWNRLELANSNMCLKKEIGGSRKMKTEYVWTNF